MAIQNPYQAYKSNTVNTASPGELTLMLYNGCLKFIKAAKIAMEAKQIEVKNNNLLKAQNIISELMVTLNMDIDVSKQMIKMYDYMNRRLIESNLKNDVSILDEVEELMIGFRDTWKEVIQLNRQKQYGGNDRA